MLAEGAAADWSAVYLSHSLRRRGRCRRARLHGFCARDDDEPRGRRPPQPTASGRSRWPRSGGAARDRRPRRSRSRSARLPVAIAGFAAMGAGLGVVVPMLFRAAASTPSVSASVGRRRGLDDRLARLPRRPARDRLRRRRVGLRAALGIVVLATVVVALLAHSARAARAACALRDVLLEPARGPLRPRRRARRLGPAIEATWRAFAERHGLDAAYVLAQIHGRRGVDLIRLVAPHSRRRRRRWRDRARGDRGQAGGLRALPGARELVELVPPDRFAIVTSGSRALAEARLRAPAFHCRACSSAPSSVEDGKPDPDGYLRAAALLGVDPAAQPRARGRSRRRRGRPCSGDDRRRRPHDQRGVVAPERPLARSRPRALCCRDATRPAAETRFRLRRRAEPHAPGCDHAASSSATSPSKAHCASGAGGGFTSVAAIALRRRRRGRGSCRRPSRRWWRASCGDSTLTGPRIGRPPRAQPPGLIRTAARSPPAATGRTPRSCRSRGLPAARSHSAPGGPPASAAAAPLP